MTRVESEPLIGGPTCVLDAGVPWPRTAPELEREWARLAVRIARVLARKPEAVEQLSTSERYVLGARAAARWTRGETDETPAARDFEPLSGAQLRVELGMAEGLMEARLPGWDYATGVVHWLLWVTGAQDEMTYPAG